MKGNKDKNGDESEDEEMEDNKKVKKMIHAQGLKAIEGMLYYLEEKGASAMDILFSITYVIMLHEDKISLTV